MPASLRHHLLPSRNPWMAEFRNLSYGEASEEISGGAPVGGQHHLDLFTDGSCWYPKLPEFALGWWAVVNATDDTLVAAGPLKGPRQSSDKAELMAIIVALELCGATGRSITIWTDSSYAASGLHRLLQCREDVPDGSHEELWIRLQHAVDSCEGLLNVQHISGHREVLATLFEVDDWTALWNARADHGAGKAQHMRSEEFMRVWRNLIQHHEAQERDLLELRALHWDVAERFVSRDNGFQDLEEEFEEDESIMDSLASNIQNEAVMWLDGIPDDWSVRVHGSGLQTKFGDSFMRKCLNVITRHLSSGDSMVRELSWIEVATWFYLELDEWLVPHRSRKGSWMEPTASAASSQTLTAMIRLIKDFFKELAFCFGLDLPCRKGISRVCLKIHTPRLSTLVKIKDVTYQEVTQTLLKFNARRPIRRGIVSQGFCFHC